MKVLDGEQTLMRIFLGESDRWQGQALEQALLELFRREGLAGTTVLKAAAGFGASSHIHTDKLLRLSSDLPVVVEVVDSAERIEAVLPQLDAMMNGGLVTLEKVRVIRYGAGKGQGHD